MPIKNLKVWVFVYNKKTKVTVITENGKELNPSEQRLHRNSKRGWTKPSSTIIQQHSCGHLEHLASQPG